MTSVEEARAALANADCLVGAAELAGVYDRLAAAIRAEYAQRNPLVLILMVGGVVAAAEILKRLEIPLEVDYLHATRYRGATHGGGLVWKRRPEVSLAGRDVLVIDDILDEGHTLLAVREALQASGPASLKVAVLAKKCHQRCAPGAYAEFVGIEIADRYVFGSGMDYKEYWRQLPGIYALASES